MNEALSVLEIIIKNLSKSARVQSKLLKELKSELERLSDYYDKCACDDAKAEAVEEIDNKINTNIAESNEAELDADELDEYRRGEPDLKAIQEEIQENREIV